MIFIYPASVSENCDTKLVPAVCKSIERFFMVQIEDAFGSGILSVRKDYNSLKNI